MLTEYKKRRKIWIAKNAVAEYAYKMRGKLDGGEYAKYSDDATRQKLVNDLQTIQDWLYGEGSNEEKNVYVDQLKSLKVR
jgi:hypothetical protein